MKIIKLAASMALLVPSLSFAAFIDGNKLHQYLTSQNNAEYVHGLGYVIGVSDFIAGSLTYPPSNVTTGQLGDMVRNYLERYPEQRHKTADLLVAVVMSAQWPCKKTGASGARGLL
jgi:hypothetical protein